MKAEHRHELKTNELAEWLANFPQWARENLRTIIIVSVVTVVAAGVGIWYWYGKNVELVQRQLDFTNLIARLSQNKMQILASQTRGTDMSFMLIETAGVLQTAAEAAKDDKMAALTFIKRAESLRAGLHYRQEVVAPAEIKTTMEQARTAYTKALEKAGPNRSLAAKAKFGLGLCEEELGNFDGARQIYTDLATSPEHEGTITVVQAKQRLETMADYQQRVVFKASPKPPPISPDLLPPSQYKPFDVNLLPQAPNLVPRVLDYNVKPDPNFVFSIPDVNQRLPRPERTPPVPDINLGLKKPGTVPEAADINIGLGAPKVVPEAVEINVPSE
jgi:hypothetical protein